MKKIMYSFVVCCMLHIGIHAQVDWHTTGNAGTTPGTNFLGTTDAQALMFKVNNNRSGYIDFDAAKGNVSFGFQALKSSTGTINAAFGYNALYSNTTGSYNTASGYSALYKNTTGRFNTASGYSALFSNTTGSQNTASGMDALQSNTTGYYNTALGMSALQSNTIGYYNTATGSYALYSNTTGNWNTALGFSALFSNTTGSQNTATGSYALYSNTTGSYNTASGEDALYSNTTGSFNTASGYSALFSNTTGNQNTASGMEALRFNTTGNYNTASGMEALYSNTTGTYNTASGLEALYFNTIGNYNTALGLGALYSNTTGNSNTALGFSAGNFNDNNTNCTFVGYDANQSVTTDFTNSMALGNASRITANNQVRVGNNAITSIGGFRGWTTLPSDGRVKKNIQANVPGLVFINKLKPLTYNLDLGAIDKIIQEQGSKTPDGKTKQATPEELAARKQKEQIVYTGFIAQDVQQAAKELNYDFSGVDAPKNDQDLYGIRYAEFVVPLTKAVQELSNLNDEKDKKIEALEERLAKLESFVLSNGNNTTSNANKTITGSSAYLKQNTPNPFNKTTVISFYTPADAQIRITDMKGVTLKTYAINKGEGQVTITNTLFAAGTYNYTLYVGGIKVDSKQMIISR